MKFFLTSLFVLCLAAVSLAEEPKLSATESSMVDAINSYRAGYHLPPLRPDSTLERVARLRVPVFNHCHPRYGWSNEHAHREGFNGPVSDNLAQGYSDGPDSVVGWTHSDGHARQMRGQMRINDCWVDQHFNCVGVARCNGNFIAVFGTAAKASGRKSGK